MHNLNIKLFLYKIYDYIYSIILKLLLIYLAVICTYAKKVILKLYLAFTVF